MHFNTFPANLEALFGKIVGPDSYFPLGSANRGTRILYTLTKHADKTFVVFLQNARGEALPVCLSLFAFSPKLCNLEPQVPKP